MKFKDLNITYLALFTVTMGWQVTVNDDYIRFFFIPYLCIVGHKFHYNQDIISMMHLHGILSKI